MEIFALIYYVFSYIESLPMMWKAIKTKRTCDYSLTGEIISFIGLICWTLYIFTSKQTLIVYIGTIVDMILGIIMFFLIFKYRKEIKNIKK